MNSSSVAKWEQLAVARIAAAGQQLHGAVVDLLIAAHGVLNGAAGLGEGWRVEDDKVVGVALFSSRGSSSKVSSQRKSMLSRPLRSAFRFAIAMASALMSAAVTRAAPPLAAFSAKLPV